MGTRFIATKQANALDDYKNMIVNSSTNDIIYTPEFTGVSANFLGDSIKNIGYNPRNLAPHSHKKPNKLLLLYKHWKMKKIKKWKDLWSAGQGVAAIHKISTVEECIDNLLTQYQAAIEEAEIQKRYL